MKKNNKKKIWFIRHGESLANADENFRSNDFSAGAVALSGKGIKQAEQLLEHFTSAPDLLITSSFIRTKQTAAPLIKKFPGVPQEEWPLHEFLYLSEKRCFGTTFAERNPWKKEYWGKSDPLHNDGEGSESFMDFIGRVSKSLEKAKNRKENFIVIFSHGYTIAAIKYLMEKRPKKITSEVMRDFKKHFKENPVPNATKVELVIK